MVLGPPAARKRLPSPASSNSGTFSRRPARASTALWGRDSKRREQRGNGGNRESMRTGLWDLSFGNGHNNGRANQLFFDAGFDAANPSGNELLGRDPRSPALKAIEIKPS